jgi:hypothetical protein
MAIAQWIARALPKLAKSKKPLANLRPESINFKSVKAQIFEYGLFGYSDIPQDLYTAPELLGYPSTIDQSAVNVYSFGMLLWFLLMGEEPCILNQSGEKLPIDS